ncbi:hypothetical protein [Devosia chinhatensis]|nr:hypothetical protein [Devosia chinhatensis]
MKRLTLLFCLLLCTPALAQFWGHYANARFGYEIDVPPDFEGNGESDNGDGQVFSNLAGEQGLQVWGGELSETLGEEAATAIDQLTRDRWVLSAQVSSPRWAQFSAQRDHRIVQQRMILLCDGASFAAFRLEHNIADLGRLDSVLSGLERSFQAQAC